MGPGTQPATHRSPSARPAASARPGDRAQAASARTQHLMLSTPAHGAAASRYAESLPLPALYPRQNPKSGRATIAPDRHHYLGANLELDAWPAAVKPLDAPSKHPSLRQLPANPSARKLFAGPASPSRPGSARISSTSRRHDPAPRLEPGRQTRRAAKVGRVHPNHPAALRQGMPWGVRTPWAA
jgi:hypothetical protein